MKGSKRFLFSTLLVVGIIVVAAGVGSRVISKKEQRLPIDTSISRETTKERKSQEERVEKEKIYEAEEFDSLKIIGAWKVTIKQGEEYGVTVNAPDKVMEEVTINKKEGILELDYDRWMGFWEGAIEATITMPTIEKIKAKGGSKITFSGFAQEDFLLDIEGASNINGIDNTVENMTIEADGAVSIDLKRSLVTNADIRLAGAGSIDIRLNGGELTGSLEGLGTVTYYGEVTRQEIETEGISEVKRGEE